MAQCDIGHVCDVSQLSPTTTNYKCVCCMCSDDLLKDSSFAVMGDDSRASWMERPRSLVTFDVDDTLDESRAKVCTTSYYHSFGIRVLGMGCGMDSIVTSIVGLNFYSVKLLKSLCVKCLRHVIDNCW